MSQLLAKAKEQFFRGDLKIALASVRRALEKDRRNGEAHILAASIHEKDGNRLEAARWFEKALPLTETHKREAGFRAATYYLDAGLSQDAIRVLTALLPIMPEDVDLNHSLCSLHREAGNYPAALPYARKLAQRGKNFQNQLNAGIVLSALELKEEALACLLAAEAINPDERLLVSELFWCASTLCDFETAERQRRKLVAAYAREGARADLRENAFRALVWSEDEAYLQRTAKLTCQMLFPPVAARRAAEPVQGRRVRIGYVSSDFFDHATLALFGGVLESHDRSRFEVFAFCHTAEARRKGRARDQMLAAVEHYVDLLGLTDDQAAEAIRVRGIDILIDLKGFTEGSRLGIFCRRPAPRQVSYLGFPGTISGAGIDAIITDRIVAPPTSAAHFGERLLYMPDSYQSNDAGRPKVARRGARSEHGLPENAIVFSAFHQPQKIRAEMFRAWMQVLAEVDGSVIWLSQATPAIERNLRHAAETQGIDPARLIFARQVGLNDHLERLAEADLALDTAPYNGHTTTSDALWAGVPVVSVRGTTFPGRVTESLLSAVGLAELVADDLPRFCQLAVRLAKDEARRKSLSDHLLKARETAPLFDTIRFTRAFEDLLADLAAEPVEAD